MEQLWTAPVFRVWNI